MGNGKSKGGSGGGGGGGAAPSEGGGREAKKQLKPSRAQKTQEERMAEYRAKLERRDSTPQAFAEDMAHLLSQRDEGKEMEAIASSSFGHAVTEPQFDLLRHEWRAARRQWKYEALVSRNLTMMLRRHMSYMSLTARIAPLVASYLEVPEAGTVARRGSVLRSSGRIQNAVLHARLSALLGIQSEASGGKADGTGEGRGLSLGALAGSDSSGDDDDSTEPSGLTPTASSPLSSNYSSQMNSARSAATDSQMNSARSAATDPARYSLEHSSVFTSDYETDDMTGSEYETDASVSALTSQAHSGDEDEDLDEEDEEEEEEEDDDDDEEEEEEEDDEEDDEEDVEEEGRKEARVAAEKEGDADQEASPAPATKKPKKKAKAVGPGGKVIKKKKKKQATTTKAGSASPKKVTKKKEATGPNGTLKRRKKKEKKAVADHPESGDDPQPVKKFKSKAATPTAADGGAGKKKKKVKVKKKKRRTASDGDEALPAKRVVRKKKVKKKRPADPGKTSAPGTPTTPSARKKEVKARLHRSHTLSAGMAVQLTAHMQRRERSGSVDSEGGGGGSDRLRARRGSTMERSRSGTLDGGSRKAAQRVARRRSLGGSMTPEEMEQLQQIARQEERERRKRQVIEEQRRRLARVTARRKRRAARELELKELMRALLEMPCIYTSEVSGNRQVKSHTRKIRWLLESLSITYRVVDVSLDHEEKEYMSKSSGRTELPQVFVTDRFRGGWDEVQAAHENDSLEQLLRPDPENGVLEVAPASPEPDPAAKQPRFMAPTKSSSFRAAKEPAAAAAAAPPPLAVPQSPASTPKMSPEVAAAAGVNGMVLA